MKYSLSFVRKNRKKNYQESYLFDFTRWWSLLFTWFFSNTPLTPNMVSILSFVITLAACGFLVAGGERNIVISGFIVWLGWVIDCVDGEVARVKGVQSSFGAWFDAIFDRVADVALFTAITVALFVQAPTLWVVVVGVLATVSTTLWRLTALYTKVSFGLPLTSKNPLKRIGFDTAFMYSLITAGLLLNSRWFSVPLPLFPWTLHFNLLFAVLLFFAVVLNMVTLKNIVSAYCRYHGRYAIPKKNMAGKRNE